MGDVPIQMPSDEKLRREYSSHTEIIGTKYVPETGLSETIRRNRVPVEFGDTVVPVILTLVAWAMWFNLEESASIGFYCFLGIFAFLLSSWPLQKLGQAFDFKQFKNDRREGAEREQRGAEREQRQNREWAARDAVWKRVAAERAEQKKQADDREADLDEWVASVLESFEGNALWKEASDLIYGSDLYGLPKAEQLEKIADDERIERIRWLLPQFVVTGPEIWGHKEIVAYPTWSVSYPLEPEEEALMPIPGYSRSLFTARKHDSGPKGPYSIDRAMEDVCDMWEIVRTDILASRTEERRGRSRTIPRDVQDRIWNRDGGRCVECGSKENLEFDHIIPFSKGGANTYRNMQLLCQSCNRSKSNKIGG